MFSAGWLSEKNAPPSVAGMTAPHGVTPGPAPQPDRRTQPDLVAHHAAAPQPGLGLLALTRRSHELRVLEALRRRGASSRAELAQAARLSRTTLSEIVADLLARGAVVVAATDAASRRGSGRPAELLALDPGAAQHVGLDLGHRRVTVAIAGPSHEVLARGEAAYPESASWEERAQHAITLVRKLETKHGLHLRAVQGVAAGVTGRERGAAEPVVAAALEAEFAAPVHVDNNVRFAGLAEAAERGTSVSTALYLQLSDGVGGAVIADGRLFRGAARSAGEFGHVVVDPKGLPCRCGKRGCLETIARSAALVGADEARLDLVGRDAGRVLAAAAMVLDPDLVVVGGRALEEHPGLLPRIARAVAEGTAGSAGASPQVLPAICGPYAGALGALLAAIHETPLLAGYDTATPAPAVAGRSAS